MGIISGRIRKQVFKKCDGRCAYCGKAVMFSQMQADHLLPTYWKVSDADLAAQNLVRGTDHIDNMMPSCKRCNAWKSKLTLEAFRAEIMDQHNKLMRDAAGYKLGIDYGFIKTEPWDGKFYFEKMPGFSMSYQRIKG